MDEMNLSQIENKLNEEFSGPGRKLIFWYDSDGEFAEDIDSLQLQGASLYKLTPTNQFYTKYFLEIEDTQNSYLLYAPFAKPDIKQNHLADTLRYSKEFFADKTSLICLDLGIREALKPVIQRHLKFFASKQRMKELYAMEKECWISPRPLSWVPIPGIKYSRTTSGEKGKNLPRQQCLYTAQAHCDMAAMGLSAWAVCTESAAH